VEGRSPTDGVTLFLCGDVMTGRGIDQVLPHPGDPRLHEPVVESAREYVELAERKNGPVPAPVYWSYVWGESLTELDRVDPDARIVNLETAVTTSDGHWPGKQVHYRMHPENAPVLAAAEIDCCVLANNHSLDWGIPGLEETLETLETLETPREPVTLEDRETSRRPATGGIQVAGAGRNAQKAREPAVLDHRSGGRVLVYGLGSTSSGIPRAWAARFDQPGIRLLEDLSPATVGALADEIHRERRDGDVVVASVHWGPNWGYGVPPAHRHFAHGLVDAAGVDVVHGHSSHHPMGIEVYEGRPILYGCGDFLNDYEGIEGYEEFRDDLAAMYFPTLDPKDGTLLRFEIVPLVIRRFRLEGPSEEDVEALKRILDREGEELGTRAELVGDGRLMLYWS